MSAIGRLRSVTRGKRDDSSWMSLGSVGIGSKARDAGRFTAAFVQHGDAHFHPEDGVRGRIGRLEKFARSSMAFNRAGFIGRWCIDCLAGLQMASSSGICSGEQSPGDGGSVENSAVGEHPCRGLGRAARPVRRCRPSVCGGGSAKSLATLRAS